MTIHLLDFKTVRLYHLQDISDYLLKFPNITNGIAFLDRSFVDMGILRPIFATIALLGIHITRPFQYLLMDTDTNYSTLLSSIANLYENLTYIVPGNYITGRTCQVLSGLVKSLHDDIAILLKIALKMSRNLSSSSVARG